MIEIRDHFRRISEALAAQAGMAGATRHASTTGKVREAIVQQFLRPHLPKDLSLRSGVIIDSTGKRSRQQDCIIVDTKLPLIDIGSDSDALLIAESVIATIEIKSYLDSDALQAALESNLQTKGLTRTGEQEYHKGAALIKLPKPQSIFTYVFAFDGIAIETLGQQVAAFAFEHKDPYCLPGAVCVLNKGVVLSPHFMPTVHEFTVTLPALKEPKMHIHPYQRDALFAFFRRLIDDVIPLRLVNYDFDAYYAEENLE